MSFSNKVVIVTGSGTGIGAVTAVKFSKEETKVVLVGKNEADLRDVAKQCSTVGSAPFVIQADVSNDDDARRIINDTVQQFGKVDVLVNNAAILEYGDILSGKVLDVYDKIILINLRAVIHLTMLAALYLVKTKGNIVYISSMAGQMCAAAPVISYAVSKAGLNHFTRSSALELAASGVRRNLLKSYAEQMGSTVEQIQEATLLKRVLKPEEIADLILFLASGKAKGITGSVYPLDNCAVCKASSDPTRNRDEVKKRTRRQRTNLNRCGSAPIATGPNYLLRAATPVTALYLSRLHYTTQSQNIVEHIKVKTNLELWVTPLKSRHNVSFRAFVVLVPTRKLDTFMKEEFWPKGVVYRRFRGRLPVDATRTASSTTPLK